MIIHFIGIGGISMSALAKLARAAGHNISGSDLNPEVSIPGVRVYCGHSGTFVPPDCNLVVYTGAITKDNPELLKAKRLGIPAMERSAFLGFIASGYEKSAAVSGTHGKTTTCGMLSSIMLGQNPTVHIGGEWDRIGGNLHMGGSGLFITEACEYRRSFVELRPDVAIINNIEPDHLDYFRDIDDIIAAFGTFAQGVKEGGAVIYNDMDARARKTASNAVPGVRRISFGSAASDYFARNINIENGCYSFCLTERGEQLGRIDLSVKGEHNLQNALAAAAAARALGADYGEIAAGLNAFTGVGRRYEYFTAINGGQVIFDYAHHPSEIRAVLKTAKAEGGRVAVIFQPHTYSRTKTLLGELAQSLALADEVYLLPTYAARETPACGLGAAALCEKLRETHPETVVLDDFQAAAAILKKIMKPDKTALVLGAGDIIGLKKFLRD